VRRQAVFRATPLLGFLTQSFLRGTAKRGNAPPDKLTHKLTDELMNLRCGLRPYIRYSLSTLSCVIFCHQNGGGYVADGFLGGGYIGGGGLSRE
jgi:hypothetical protein